MNKNEVVRKTLAVLKQKGLLNEAKLQEYNKSLKENEMRYPEFASAVESIVAEVIGRINQEAEKITSKMPYKAQYMLEEVIKELESRV